MGGAWERMIRSTRIILKALVREQLLTDEQLQTLMAEAERIMNDRPITPVIGLSFIILSASAIKATPRTHQLSHLAWCY